MNGHLDREMIAAATTSTPAELAHTPFPLCAVLDVGGTLIPHGPRPLHAWIDDADVLLLADLASAANTFVAVVSGRRRVELDAMLGRVPGLFLVAEHGAWRRVPHGTWQPAPLAGTTPDTIEHELEAIVGQYAGATIERKRWSICVQFAQVALATRDRLLGATGRTMRRWIVGHPEYEILEGTCALEIRHRGANKGSAIDWLRENLPADTRFVAIGDDPTDEDTFGRLREVDVGIQVGPSERPTRAHAHLPDTTSVHAFLRELVRARG
jgi:trehalose-phosphatase